MFHVGGPELTRQAGTPGLDALGLPLNRPLGAAPHTLHHGMHGLRGLYLDWLNMHLASVRRMCTALALCATGRVLLIARHGHAMRWPVRVCSYGAIGCGAAPFTDFAGQWFVTQRHCTGLWPNGWRCLRLRVHVESDVFVSRVVVQPHGACDRGKYSAVWLLWGGWLCLHFTGRSCSVVAPDYRMHRSSRVCVILELFTWRV